MDARPITRPTLANTSRRGLIARTNRPATTTLAISFGADGALPTEFRLFTPGWNDTENGRYLFDETAAASVMAAHAKWGVDLMIDLEHQALNAGTPPEPTARDARGWFRLELRTDGSLWATGVSWTTDGEQRLRDKRQRYVSPAFSVDPETSRITSIVNVALVAIPATHETPALVAASARGNEMDAALVKQALDALIAEDAPAALEILKGLVLSAAGGEAESEEAPAEEPAAADPVEMAAPVEPPVEEKKEEIMAASARLMRLSGATSFGAAVEEVEVWRTSHLKLEAETVKLAKERATLEMSKRKENAIALTKLGAETPHTTGLAKGKLCKRLAEEPLDEQNERISALLAARGGKLPEAPQVPTTVALSTEFTASELAAMKATGCDPATFARLKAGRTPTV